MKVVFQNACACRAFTAYMDNSPLCSACNMLGENYGRLDWIANNAATFKASNLTPKTMKLHQT